MKKTLVTLFALAGVASAATSLVSTDGVITLDGTQSVDTRADMAYNSIADQTIITTVDNVTIYGTDGYGLNTTNASLTFDIQYQLTATNNIKLASTGDTSSVNVETAITSTELAALDTNGVVSRWIVQADIFNNIGAYITNDRVGLSLDGLSGYADGGLIFDMNGAYYNASDITFSGDYATVKTGATAIDLDDGTVYTTLKITANQGASVKGIGYVATAIVPEPATASLSLLGLAALMIRRRR